MTLFTQFTLQHRLEDRDDTLLLQHCFVDASNLNEVKRELAVRAAAAAAAGIQCWLQTTHPQCLVLVECWQVEGLVDSDAAMLGHMLEQSQLEVDMDRVPRVSRVCCASSCSS